MKTIAINTLYEVLRGYEMSLVFKAQNESDKGNVSKSQIYSAKANTVRECIRLIRSIE